MVRETGGAGYEFVCVCACVCVFALRQAKESKDSIELKHGIEHANATAHSSSFEFGGRASRI